MPNKISHIKIATAILLANAAVIYGWFWFYGATDAVRSEIYATRTGLAEIDARVANIKHLENLLEEVGDKRGIVSNSFIDHKSLVTFIEKMEEIATTTAVAMKVENASVPINEKGLGPSFRLEIAGSFSGIYKFIDMLAATDHQVLLDKMYLEKNLDENKNYAWRANLEIRVLNFIFTLNDETAFELLFNEFRRETKSVKIGLVPEVQPIFTDKLSRKSLKIAERKLKWAVS